MDKENIRKKIDGHRKWKIGTEDGQKADFTGAVLTDAKIDNAIGFTEGQRGNIQSLVAQRAAVVAEKPVNPAQDSKHTTPVREGGDSR